MPVIADTKCYGDIVLRKKCVVLLKQDSVVGGHQCADVQQGVQASEFAYIVSCARNLVKDTKAPSKETND